MSFFNIFSLDSSKKILAKIQPIIKEINDLEPKFEKLSDKQLKEKTAEFELIILKQRKKQGIEPENEIDLNINQRKEIQKKEQVILDEILPQAFATVREAAKRVISQRHYDVQLIGGVALHLGKIAEMKTGEGKTLVATLPLYLNSLLGRGAHLVTVNDFLAKSHTQWMGPIYNFLGLSVGCINHEKAYIFERTESDIIFGEEHNLKQVTKKQAYQADITYGTNNEFGFDYLRDNMSTELNQQAQGELCYAIVDEIDSILIDEARTPLIISAPAEQSNDYYRQFAQVVKNLENEKDYVVDEKDHAVSINNNGIEKVEKSLGIKNIYESGGTELVHHLEQALKAKELFKRDKDYVVSDGEVVIVDQFTGRMMPGRRFSEGLHQAIEAKEKVEIKQESLTYATISFQNYFRLYSKMGGMTGTAKTEEEEFFKIYSVEVVVIPTNREIVRDDFSDKIYKSEEAKFKAVAKDVKSKFEAGQPVLIGTIAVEKSELLSDILKRNGVPHKVLNAKHHEQESKIIANAGKIGAITVATNMAGRGVDIILGGEKPLQSDSKTTVKEWEKNHQKVLELGGLHVIGTERHESRRIDNQLRGRSGRQGDPGSSQFYVSMEDDLMRVFGGDKLKNMMNLLKIPDNMPIQNKMISKSIEGAQKRVEGHNFDTRKQLVEYDDVMNKHRETIYEKRQHILEAENLKEEITSIVVNYFKNVADNDEELKNYYNNSIGEQYLPKDYIKNNIEDNIKYAYDVKTKEWGENASSVEKVVYLKTIDNLWVEHLTVMDELRDSVGLVGYGQRDPLSEYKQQAFKKFNDLLNAINDLTASTIFKITLQPQTTINSTPNQKMSYKSSKKEDASLKSSGSKKVGRNDPCPCGSGKKYKKCCGK